MTENGQGDEKAEECWQHRKKQQARDNHPERSARPADANGHGDPGDVARPDGRRQGSIAQPLDRRGSGDLRSSAAVAAEICHTLGRAEMPGT